MTKQIKVCLYDEEVSNISIDDGKKMSPSLGDVTEKEYLLQLIDQMQEAGIIRKTGEDTFEIVRDGRWKPKEGENYFWIAGDGVIMFEEWNRNHGDFENHTWEMGNCFLTREQAEQARDKVKETLINFHKENYGEPKEN